MRLVMSLVVGLVLLSATSVNAAEMDLSAMGLKGLKPMTATEGRQVRGKAVITATSFAHLFSIYRANAGGNTGFAAGFSFGYAR